MAGCAVAPGRSAGPGQALSAQPLSQLTVVTPDADHDLLAQLMAGEMALTRTDLKAAAAAYGKAMLLSDDSHVAEQAAGMAIAVHDDALAQQAITRWQALGAKPGELAQARAQLALDQGNADEAQRQLDLLLRSGSQDAWRQFGRVLIGGRDPALAARLLESLATPQRLPADAQAWLAMSELGDRLGRHAYAQQVADAAAKRFNSAETYAWAAQMKFKSGDRAGAQGLFQKALAKAPKNTRLRLAYATLLGQSGDYAGAAKLLDSGPQDTDTYTLRAALAARANDTKSLSRLYTQLQHSPESVRSGSAYLLGQLAEMQGRKDEALTWYGQVPDGDDHAFDADLRSAVLMHALGKPEQAHEELAQMQVDYLDQPTQLQRVYAVDAELYMREQQYGKAEAVYSRALQVAPDDPELLYGRGLAYAEAGSVDQAVSDLRRLLQLKPDDMDASNALGYTLADANRDLPEAEKLIQAARVTKPDDPAIADSWGWLQYRLGHLDQAEQALRGAWNARKDADVGVHLGEVLWKQGRQQDAGRIFEEVRRLDPQSARLHDTLKRLNP
ncbi:tetratricopeptide repeat protein [Dyella tabacisoli]|uniref:Tetratricopeptide repeat protein n=1 Tax=Dyella tabacisoli TaxID=2282381 RepID=A0A369UMU5_9GAMM|nr:tetratricopeptide repeat protein [Dyella tabacisoli]RDD81851.1 tetratricopeptide repeat protein [Dyella tabacisoli]